MRYTEISIFQQCPEKYRLTFEEKLEPAYSKEETEARDFGAAIHKGLENWYRTKSLGQAIASALDNYMPAKDDVVSSSIAIENTLKEYIKFYQEIDKNWKVLGVEVADTFTINGIEWEVHIDLIAENLQGGGIYFWDHKTRFLGRGASRFDFSYWKKFELDTQITTYTDYVNQKYGQCSGALINAIGVGHRQKMYRGEPAGYYFDFQRHIFNRSKREIEYFRNNMTVWKARIEEAKSRALWGRHEGKLCDWCEFRDLCVSCCDEQVQTTMYKIKENLNENNSDSLGFPTKFSSFS